MSGWYFTQEVMEESGPRIKSVERAILNSFPSLNHFLEALSPTSSHYQQALQVMQTFQRKPRNFPYTYYFGSGLGNGWRPPISIIQAEKLSEQLRKFVVEAMGHEAEHLFTSLIRLRTSSSPREELSHEAIGNLENFMAEDISIYNRLLRTAEF